MPDTAKWVPVDLLTPEELRHMIGKALVDEKFTPSPKLLDTVVNAIVAAQGGYLHELDAAWSKGVADARATERYPWISDHLVSPYQEAIDEMTKEKQ